MNGRTALFTVAVLLVAGSVWAQVSPYMVFQMEDADPLGTNYQVLSDTNVPPGAFGTYITPTEDRGGQNPNTDPWGPPETAVYWIGDLPANTLWDLYVRVSIDPADPYNDDSFFPADALWDWFATNSYYMGYGAGANGLAGLTAITGSNTTDAGFHWVNMSGNFGDLGVTNGAYSTFDGISLSWACAPREDGLNMDAFALVWSGLTVTDEMLDPANSDVEAWPGGHAPTYPSPTPLPELSAMFLDGAGTVDGGSATMTVNGVPVSGLSVSYTNFVTTVTYTPTVPFDVPSTNTAMVVVASSPGGMPVTNTFAFEVIESDQPDGNIVYVDADTANTLIRGPEGVYTNWTPLVSGAYTGGQTNWNQRPYANEGTIITSQGDLDNGRLKTSVTNLPLGVYNVYVYFWALQGGCIIETALEDNPSGPLPVYRADAQADDPDIHVHYQDALDARPWGDFGNPTPDPYLSTNATLLSNPFNTNAVMLAEGDRRLMQLHLGAVAATEFSVFVDEDTANDWPDRVWYDGVGYEEVTDGTVVLASRSPFPGSPYLETATVSLGAVLYDINETLDAGTVELYLDGGADLITGGDVTKTGITTTVSHDVSSLSPGTHTVDLVYATVETGTPVTNSWTFRTVPDWPGTRVYVDADTTNTLAWNGASYGAWTPVASGDNDPNWRLRTGFANGGTVVQCGYDTNSVRLLTSVSGLPNDTYRVFAYHWVASGGEWRLGADLADPGPGSELPLYVDQDYPKPGRLYSHYQDAENAVPYNDNAHDVDSSQLLSNPFTTVVQVGEGNRQMIEVYLGTVSGTEIAVYVDDDADAPDWQRTWYDGIGYDVVPGGAWLSPNIRSSSVAGGTATLTWESETVGTYSIASKTNLTDAAWTPVKTGIAGAVSTTTDSVPASGEAQEFFQIQGN